MVGRIGRRTEPPKLDIRPGFALADSRFDRANIETIIDGQIPDDSVLAERRARSAADRAFADRIPTETAAGPSTARTLLIVFGAILMSLLIRRYSLFADGDEWVWLRAVFVLSGTAILGGAWRAYMAYKHYMRMGFPLMTVLSSQVIVFMLVLVVLFRWDFRLAYTLVHLLGVL